MSWRERIRDAVAIPSMPDVVTRITALLDDPRAGVSEVAQAVARDPPIAAKVLRIANSVHFAMSEPAVGIARAVSVLGQRMVRNIVLQVAVVERYAHLAATPGFDLAQLWRHSILTALISQRLARRRADQSLLSPEEFYTCGLLHDLGKVAMLEALGADFVAAVADARAKGRPSFFSERELLGFAHDEVGTLIAESWDLPAEVVTAIQHHHDHGPLGKVENNPTVAIVSMADRIANAVAVQDFDELDALRAPPVWRLVGLDGGALRASVEFAAESVEHIEV